MGLEGFLGKSLVAFNKGRPKHAQIEVRSDDCEGKGWAYLGVVVAEGDRFDRGTIGWVQDKSPEVPWSELLELLNDKDLKGQLTNLLSSWLFNQKATERYGCWLILQESY